MRSPRFAVLVGAAALIGVFGGACSADAAGKSSKKEPTPAAKPAAKSKKAEPKREAPSAQKSKGAPPAVADHVRRLQARYDQTEDFTADFTQSVDVPTLDQTLDSSGKVFFKRPGRMRWEFAEPEKQLIVADGATLWVYQPEHRQVLKAPFRAAFRSTTPVSFLFGVGKLTDDFRPTLIEASEKLVRLKLEPKQDTEIGTIVLSADRGTYDIVSAEITDPLGNVTRLAFQSLKRDVGLKNSDFVFKVPDGVDIVESPGEPGPGG